MQVSATMTSLAKDAKPANGAYPKAISAPLSPPVRG